MDEKGLACEGVVVNTIPGKEAEDVAVVSRRRGPGAPARRPVFRRAAERGSYPRRAGRRKAVLAGLGLHAGGHGVGVPRAVPQPGPFLPRRGGAAHRLAPRARAEGLLGRHGRVLHGPRRPAGGRLRAAGPRHARGGWRTRRRMLGSGTAAGCAWWTARRSRCRTRPRTRPSTRS